MRTLFVSLFLIVMLVFNASGQVPAPTYPYFFTTALRCNPSNCVNQTFIPPGFSGRLTQDVSVICANGTIPGISAYFLGILCAQLTELAVYMYTGPYTWPYYVGVGPFTPPVGYGRNRSKWLWSHILWWGIPTHRCLKRSSTMTASSHQPFTSREFMEQESAKLPFMVESQQQQRGAPSESPSGAGWHGLHPGKAQHWGIGVHDYPSLLGLLTTTFERLYDRTSDPQDMIQLMEMDILKLRQKCK